MELIEYGKSDAPVVLVQPVSEHGIALLDNEVSLIRENTSDEFLLAAFKVYDWNRDLSPWKAPAVFGNDDFGDGATATLNEILKYCEDNSRTYYIGGYSLAGLFALWAAYQTDRFTGVAAASPSMWFPGFIDHMRSRELQSRLVYLSLGDKESKTRNPVMATVGERIQTACEIVKRQGADCVLQWNEGNHFKDPEIRTARAFSWVLGRK